MQVAFEDQSPARFFSIQGLFPLLALLVLVPVALLTAAAIYNAEKEYAQAEVQATAEAQAFAQRAAFRLDEYYDEVDLFLGAVAEIAREVIGRGVDDDAALSRLLASMPQHVTGLSVFSVDGRMLASSAAPREARATLNVSDRVYFREALAQRRTVVSEPVISRTSKQWIVISGRPVFGANGAIAGVVSMSTRVAHFDSVLVPIGLPLGTLVTVFNDKGVGIASSDEPLAVVGRDLTRSEAVQRALRERALTIRGLASDGKDRFAAYTAGEKLPWIVEVGLDADRTLALARLRHKQRLGYLLAALLTGVAAAYVLARRIARPLRSLTQSAQKIAVGDYGARVVVEGYHEARQLGRAFNVMAAAVASKQDELKASESRFRSLTELSSDWYWTQDAEFRFNSHSQGRFGDGFALGAGDFHGKTRWEMPGAEPLGTTWEAHRALLKEHRTWRDLVVRYVDQNGETQYIASSGEPIFHPNGELAGYRGVAQLVTERFRLESEHAAAEAAVRKSEERLRATLDYSPNVAVQWYDRAGRVRYWNKASTVVFGWDADEVMGRTLDEVGLYTPQQAREFMAQLRAIDEAGPRTQPAETRFFRKDGTEGVIVSTSFSIPSLSGEERYVCMDVEVTQRVRLEQESQERMELLRVTLDTASVAIGVVRTRDNVVLLSNRAAHEMLCIDPARREWNVLDYWERREDAREVKRRIARDGYVRDMEALVRVPGRASLWVLVSAQPARYLGEDVTVATVIDITERKALEAQRESLLTNLRGANERLRRLSAQVLDAQEAERRQIAHELHDEVGQNLSALKLFAGHLRGNAPTALHAQIDDWIAVLDSSLAQLRDLTRLLRPVQLDHMGLVPALRALLDTQANAAGWLTQFEATGSDARFDTRIETVCYRVVQEALTNAVRHAAAASVALRVHCGTHSIRIEVEDDGRGFDLGTSHTRIQQGLSMGLLGMEERVQLAGGTLEIDSALARGTRLTVALPLVSAAPPSVLQPSQPGGA